MSTRVLLATGGSAGAAEAARYAGQLAQLTGMLLSSASHKVLAHATAPVLVVRPA